MNSAHVLKTMPRGRSRPEDCFEGYTPPRTAAQGRRAFAELLLRGAGFAQSRSANNGQSSFFGPYVVLECRKHVAE